MRRQEGAGRDASGGAGGTLDGELRRAWKTAKPVEIGAVDLARMGYARNGM